MKQEFLEAGKVRNTHALRGEVKFECWLDGQKPLSGVDFLYCSKKDEKKMKIRSCRVQGDVLLIAFEGIDTVEEAALLKGKTLYAARKELDPRDEKIFFADLIGLPLIEEGSDAAYGTVKEVTSRGASELFLVALPDGREAYFPAVKEFVVKMDTEKGIYVRAPKGIFD